jgi:hypothetical protein
MPNSTLSKKLASVKPGAVFVGVDLALGRNVAVVLTERAEQLARFGFPNEREGYDYFYRHLEAIQERQQACEGLEADFDIRVSRLPRIALAVGYLQPLQGQDCMRVQFFAWPLGRAGCCVLVRVATRRRLTQPFISESQCLLVPLFARMASLTSRSCAASRSNSP